jgi:hypothetical protein
MGRRTRMFLLKPNSLQGWGFFEIHLLRLPGRLAQDEYERYREE